MPAPLPPPRPAAFPAWTRRAWSAALLGALLLLSGAAPPAPGRRVELWFGGDVHLGGGGKGALGPLAALVRGADGIVNLEGPVAPAAPRGPGLKLHNAPAALAELRALGVAVAGIANNHAGDAGPSGARATAQAVRASGLLPAGGPAGAAVLERNGLRIAVTAHDLTGGVPPALAEELKAARASADVLIATFHVTGPAVYAPRPELRRAVEVALAAGARGVVAHGTHAVAKVERRGDAVIAWGLGNVAFACDCTDERDALLLRVLLVEGRVERVELVPIDAGLSGGKAQPSEDAGGVLDLLESLGGTPFRREGGRGVLAP